MTTTLAIAGWLVAIRYMIAAGGPFAIFRALRDPDTPRGYKVVLALCALPIPGPVDDIVAALVLQRLAAQRGDTR